MRIELLRAFVASLKASLDYMRLAEEKVDPLLPDDLWESGKDAYQRMMSSLGEAQDSADTIISELDERDTNYEYRRENMQA